IIKIWSKDGKLLKTFQKHSKSVKSIAWSPDGQTLASASADKTIKIWSKDGQELGTLKGHSDAVNSVSFSLDGKSVASASDDKTVLLWNLELLDRDILFKRGCNWVRGYLMTNPNVTQEDRHLCDRLQRS
ncbi:WD40 repeat domain-containing protein, partial [Allocoleopsis sp.]|uniref:WD40 repeat domain-containing protein n=1 Tax=Allocoleopsis sp. TaxID=3088169 RepID=UPI002FE7B949